MLVSAHSRRLHSQCVLRLAAGTSQVKRWCANGKDLQRGRGALQTGIVSKAPPNASERFWRSLD